MDEKDKITKGVAPYGLWKSEISVDSVVSKSRSLSSPRASKKSGRAFYTESRELGGTSIIEVIVDELTKAVSLNDVLPAEYSAKNSVYEYGGVTFAVLPDDRIIFSNKDDTVHILNPDTKEVSPLTGASKLRYSDFDANPKDHWVLSNQEDHTIDTPAGVRNYIVAINAQTGEVKRILTSADFYYTPYFSPDGNKLVWLEWNHPDLPFDAAKLYLATWHADGSISNTVLIAGGDREGVAEPRWGPDGSLFFCKEIRGYRKLFRLPPGQNVPTEVQVDSRLDEAEFGEIRWFQGSHTYAPLSRRQIVACPLKAGTSELTLIDLDTGSCKVLAGASFITEVVLNALFRVDDTTFLVIAAGSHNAQTLYRFEVGDDEGSFTVLRSSSEEKVDRMMYSLPESLAIYSKETPTRTIHGFLWLPHNPWFEAPSGSLPPLIMICHGGPTSYHGPGLKLRIQYFTSRGYAVLALNHAGSTGYGQKYRNALFGNWGLVDADDGAELVEYLVEEGRVRHGAAGITGVSSGGYNTLRTLTRHPRTFAAGVCLSGISDVKKLDESTHKLESDYTDHLMLSPGSSKADKERICRERSPLYDVDKIRASLLLLHGAKDKVTPLDQAQLIADAIRAKGGVVKFIVAPDEGHGFSQPHNVRLWLEEEEAWWRRRLLNLDQ
ncbi:Alpha/Beta hydrolase protein [Thelonectria olida]|uniref:Alpha/Beta hydrolase protein n=1 Tax=Thelonectria olida TaxID=1576542 RepID=A0A9P9AX49_9HYPO|nr:Alpha/Beta hydrolase protein [Thelonectria olida]